MNNYKIYVFCVIIANFALTNTLKLQGQNLLNSRKTSYYTYIYKLNPVEQNKLFTTKDSVLNPSYFHTIVDSFPTDSSYKGNLPQGCYLKTFAEANNQHYTVYPIQKFEAFIIDNSTDLVVQVYDFKGNVISDADVRIGKKKLRYNEQTKTYIHRKSNKEGILKITQNGYTAYYSIFRVYNNSFLKRAIRAILFRTPLKYIAKPLYMLRYGFEEFFAYFKKNNENSKYRFDGYIVTNKPKYFPNDTLKFKSYIIGVKGLPLEPVNVYLQEYSEPKKFIKQILPYNDGGYECSIFLHDSLNLKLGSNYTIFLESDRDRGYISTHFNFEDYELKKNTLTIRTSEPNQIKNKEFNVFVKGTDDNDLNILDAQLEVVVEPILVKNFFEKYSFIPDTLMYYSMILDPINETEIVIPDSIFPKANLSYKLTIKLKTSDNEVIVKTEDINYYYEKEEFRLELQKDSIVFKYYKDGVPTETIADILATDQKGNDLLLNRCTIPTTLLFDAYFNSYTVQNEHIEETLYINKESSLIKGGNERTRDSVHIFVENPRKIKFTYFLYENNTEISSGNTDSLNIKLEANRESSYYLALNYIWGGNVERKRILIPNISKALNLQIVEPQVIYPGQKVKIDLIVTDGDGNPVEGVDLTAYSLTKKFDYTPIKLESNNEYSKKIINWFRQEEYEPKLKDEGDFILDYNYWNSLTNLDSIEYYKFSHPNNSVYSTQFQIKDSITQFAPFIFNNGEERPIHIIYRDNVPVYFSWTKNTTPYSFRIGEGYHQIKLRTANKLITLDSLYFSAGKKTIFSIDEKNNQPNIKIQEVDATLSYKEKENLYKYMISVKPARDTELEYLVKNDDIILLKKSYVDHDNFLGPITGDLKYINLHKNIDVDFIHEPYFNYEFAPGLLKMRNIDKKFYPTNLTRYSISNHHFSDTVFSKDIIAKDLQEFRNRKRYNRNVGYYSNYTLPKFGSLSFSFEGQKLNPINVFLFKPDSDSFIRVYSGETNQIHNLSNGLYKLIFLFSNAKYFVQDSVFVKTGGSNHYIFKTETTMLTDSFSIEVNKKIENIFIEDNSPGNKYLLDILNLYNGFFSQCGEGNVLTGRVFDPYIKIPINDVSIVINKCDRIIAQSKSDSLGAYSIKNIPPGIYSITFSRFGCSSETIDNVQINKYGTTFLNASISIISNTLSNVDIIEYKIPLISRDCTQSGGFIYNYEVEELNPNYAKTTTVGGINLQDGTLSWLPQDNTVYYIDGVKVRASSSVPKSAIEDIQTIYSDSDEIPDTVYITTKKSFNTKQNLDEFLLDEAFQRKSIRENFSDYAFWQPKLITNKDGRASFETKFPDDVTSWETFYIAMNAKYNPVQRQNIIKSYKPLIAQLSTPHFMVESDTTLAIGKIFNYTIDSIKLQSHYEVNDHKSSFGEQYCVYAIIDTLSTIADRDTTVIKYYFETNKGYYDGELRKIPVFPLGLSETKGEFIAMDNDTSFTIDYEPDMGQVYVYAENNISNIFKTEIENLISYQYNCNEQVASKLKAALTYQLLKENNNSKSNYKKEIEKLIATLRSNRNKNGLWGWWNISSENDWISLHVLESIVLAEQQGYKTKININDAEQYLIWKMESQTDFKSNALIIKMLHLMKSKIDFLTYIKYLEKSDTKKSFHNFLNLLEIKQLYGLEVNVDTLKKYRKKTLLGNSYYTDNSNSENITSTDVLNTLMVYRILKRDTLDHTLELRKIRNYFLENRKNEQWVNTFESAQIIETVFQDIQKESLDMTGNSLIVKQGINIDTITTFPYSLTLKPNNRIEIFKFGNNPLYFSYYQKSLNRNPQLTKGDFEINTRLVNKDENILIAGMESTIIVDVNVRKDAEFVMITIPIPGGCSYADKKDRSMVESHRENYKNETVIFCDKLPKGHHRFNVYLMPRFLGTYNLNPAKIELMYFPVFKANNEIKKVLIKPNTCL